MARFYSPIFAIMRMTMRPTRLTGIDFDGIQLFERIARNGNISSAAREIGITPSSATRKLIALENALNAKLFHRSTRQLSITDAGRAALTWAQTALVELDTVADDMAAVTGSPAGRIRIAAPHFGMNTYMPPVLSAFSRLYPDVALELTTTDDMVSPIEDGFDVVIHYGIIPDSRAVAFRITEFDRILCASQDYVKTWGKPERLHDLVEHQCIVHRQTDAASWAFRKGDQIFHQPIRARIEVDNSFCSFAFCEGGAGIGRVARVQVLDKLEAGQLVQILPEYQCADASGDTPSLWLIYASRDLPYRVRLMVEHLKQAIPEARQKLYGGYA